MYPLTSRATPYGTYSRSPEQIVNAYYERRHLRGPVIQAMSAIRDQVNGDIIVPLPEMDTNEQSFVPNLVQTAVDQYGSRIASMMPDLECPPVGRGKAAMEKADLRRRANLAWWQANHINRQMRRRARWLVAYSTAPVSIRPDFTREIPRWEPRNPLTVFPSDSLDPDDLTPTDTIYAQLRPMKWLKDRYPDAALTLAPTGCDENVPVTVLEYDDAEQICTIALHIPSQRNGAAFKVLECIPNRAGIALSVVPGRITLDRLAGQFDGNLGMYQMRAQLMALEVLAVREGVFSTKILIEREGEVGEIAGGKLEPGYTGIVNVVRGGDLKEMTVNPAFAALQTVDRLERAERIQAGIPAEFGGESGTNIRTGRRGEAVMASTVDFPIQEAQETLGLSMEEENLRATKVAKAYFGNVPKSFHVNRKGAKGHVTYTPNKDFDSDYTVVRFPMPGFDTNNLITGVGQRLGMGTISKRTAMRLDPLIDDPDFEVDQSMTEGIDAALLQGFQAAVAEGRITPADAARVKKLVRDQNVDLADAIERVNEEAQRRQAAVTAEGAPDGVDPLSPAAQPGLGDPGMGEEAGVAIPEMPTSMGNLEQFLQGARGIARGAA